MDTSLLQRSHFLSISDSDLSATFFRIISRHCLFTSRASALIPYILLLLNFFELEFHFQLFSSQNTRVSETKTVHIVGRCVPLFVCLPLRHFDFFPHQAFPARSLTQANQGKRQITGTLLPPWQPIRCTQWTPVRC